MKDTEHGNYSTRCKTCERGNNEHAQEGKCLYGPGWFVPWRCDDEDCMIMERAFRMDMTIYLSAKGAYLHGACARAASMEHSPLQTVYS